MIHGIQFNVSNIGNLITNRALKYDSLCLLLSPGPMTLSALRSRCQVLVLFQRLVHSIYQQHSTTLPPSLQLDLLDILLETVRQAAAANADSGFRQLLSDYVAMQHTGVPMPAPSDGQDPSPQGVSPICVVAVAVFNFWDCALIQWGSFQHPKAMKSHLKIVDKHDITYQI